MLNDIITSIAEIISAVFGDEYKIYKNDVEQGMDTPCFFVAALKPSVTAYPSMRRYLQHPLDVHYYPRDSCDNGNMYEVAERLADILEYITLPDNTILRGTDISYQIEDDVLHYFVSFNAFVRMELERVPEMEELDIYAYPKNDSQNKGGAGSGSGNGGNGEDDGDDLMGEIQL